MSIDLLPSLGGAAIRAVGLGLAALAGLLLFRVRSSAARHATWTVVLAGMLLQIPLGWLTPTVALKVLPVRADLPMPVRGMEAPPAPAAAAQISRPAGNAHAERKRGWLPSSETLSATYLAISLLLFMRMVIGQRALRRVLRGARHIAELGPEIHECEAFVAPASVGCFRPRIVLPRAWRSWDAAKLRAVLAHERSHLRRRDTLIRFASHINLCVFWFHPLAWWMERELSQLAEEACDDAAVRETGDPEEYAAALVDIARIAAADALNWPVISMAGCSKVLRRVDRILERMTEIPQPFGRSAWLALFGCGLPMIYLCAAVRLTPAVVSALPAKAADEPVRLIAQATPNQPVKPAQPPSSPAPSRRGDSPLTMCIVIDNSGSMRNKREAAKSAALALVKASRPGDRVCIVDFNDEVYLDLPHGEDFTGDIDEMEAAIARFDSRGGKAMRDAVRMSIGHVQQADRGGRTVLVLITEGNDSASAVSQAQLIGEVRGSGVRIYAIGLVGDDDPVRAGAARDALGQIAKASGGADYYPTDLAEVETVSSDVAKELRK